MRNWRNVLPVALALSITACASNQGMESSKAVHNTAPPLVQYGNAKASGQTVRTADPFRSDAPNTYIVRRGDSLWAIAGKFLNNPGRWKEIWHANTQLKNPNRIYPGDVLAIKSFGGKKRVYVKKRVASNMGRFTGKRTSGGLKIYDVKPRVTNEKLDVPVPTFPVSALVPFMDKNLIVQGGLDEFGYVLGDSSNSYLSLTSKDLVYAKGDFTQDAYDVYRLENVVEDPFDGREYGREANYVGELLLVKMPNDDGVGTFRQIDQYRPLMRNDILVAREEAPSGQSLNVFPSLYGGDDSFYVIKTVGRNLTGTQFNTLLVNGGKDQGVKEGQVFSIVRGTTPQGAGRNGETVRLPDYEVGIGMVYKTMDNLSYVLVMNANDIIYAKDRLVVPSE